MRSKVVTILIFYVLLPILSIGIGYVASKDYIIPHFVKYDKKAETNALPVSTEETTKDNTDGENVQSSKKTEETVFKSFEMDGSVFYCIQVGSFSTIENANAAVNTLAGQDYGGYIWKNNGYKVFASAAFDRSDAERTLPLIQGYDKAAFIVPIQIPNRKIDFDSKDELAASTLKSQNEKLLEVFRSLSVAAVETINNQTPESNKNMKDLKTDSLSSLNNIKGEILKQHPTGQMKEAYEAYNTMLDQIIGAIEETDMQSRSKISNVLLKSLFHYYEINTAN